jgi:predicted alpha/beta-hydrolase family hydrolase
MDYPAATGNRAGVTLILGHGAGAGQTSGFMVAFATALAERGIDIVTFNFLYSELRRRIPDPNARLESCWRAVIETVRSRITSNADRLAIGGKSMGGRIASQVAAGEARGLAGLVFLGYPLHPPGRPDRLRAAHLGDVKAPMLFVQGTRDPFGTPPSCSRSSASSIPPRICSLSKAGTIRSRFPRAPGSGNRTCIALSRIGSKPGCG